MGKEFVVSESIIVNHACHPLFVGKKSWLVSLLLLLLFVGKEFVVLY